jgi:uncharacterized protein (TIRG00374 family)
VGRTTAEERELNFRLKRADLDRWAPFLIVVVALSGIVFILLDWSKIKPVLAQTDWRPIPLALLVTVISYTFLSVSFAKVSKLLGVLMPTKELSIVGFISTALNHIVLSGGAAGYSVRFMLMSRFGVTMREVIAISILHFYLTALWMIAMVPVSMIYLALNATLNQSTATILYITGAILLLGTALFTALIFSHKSRKKVIDFLARLIPSLIRRDVTAPLEQFDATMEQGIMAMRQQPFSAAAIATLIILDWIFSVAALWFCFRALDLSPSAGQLVSGFVIGTVAGVSSFLPGGLGVQEASMTGIFALFGIPVERAALVAILFRVVFTIIPYLVSLGFYKVVLNQNNRRTRVNGREPEYEDPSI